MARTVFSDVQNPSEQLRCPKSKMGKELWCSMYDGSKNMLDEAIAALKITKRNRILEIDPGNGEHLGEILGRELGTRYFGLDISEAMIAKAKQINNKFIEGRKALFERYNGKNVPFVHNFFDRILTVNTIYFWEAPKLFLNELYRVLKPGGIIVITFFDTNAMRDLPFVNDSFELYDISRSTKLVSGFGFTNIDIQTKTDRIQSKDGETVDREYIVISLQKKKETPEKEQDILIKKSVRKIKCNGH